MRPLNTIKLINIPWLSNKEKPSSDSLQADLALLPPPPVWSRVLIWTLGSGSVFIIIWSVFARVEETVMLQGEIATANPAVQVAAQYPGEISSILIRPHQPIESGDPLIIYGDDETALRLDSLRTRSKLLAFQSEKEMKMYDYRMLESEDQLKLDKDLLQRLTGLLEEGAIQETQVLEKRTQVKKSQLAISSLIVEKQHALHKIEQNNEEINASIRELEAKTKRFTITAPVKGFIHEVKYQSPGERIQPGEVVATIIPDRELIAKVRIPSKLSAPVEVETSASLEVDAFPSSEFGSVEAKVISLSPMTSNESRDSAQKIYSADLKLVKTSLPDQLSLDQLKPGMAITARLKLRDKAVITTVFDVLSKLFTPLNEQR
ncbi:HlyD family secretion protein [Prochlorococcus sp. MIT 1303]|uniref:HlyD family secretion protein n=1 Tax=Prochlorococcus sp. MIT 1303 TaxID=1723647 RepID=UPI000A4AF0F5|nr:HlyD family efflux transporter periplasmic adaptor subunit [Prochlorococcus sp. MIT 1303]